MDKKYLEYKKVIQKEYMKNQKYIFTCYFFLFLSVVLFSVFFLRVRELPVFGTAFLMDAVAVIYLIRAIKSKHPYWEMQLALKAKRNPNDFNVYRYAASVEYAVEQQWKAFEGRAPEIFAEAADCINNCVDVSEDAKNAMNSAINSIKRA